MFHLVFPFENPPTPVRVSPSCRAEVHSASEGAPLTAMRCKASCGELAAVLKSFSRSCLAIWTESAARHGDRLAKKNGELMMYIYHIYHSIYIIYIYVCVAICIYIYIIYLGCRTWVTFMGTMVSSPWFRREHNNYETPATGFLRLQVCVCV